VYRKYKASAEMSAGGRVYTEDSGTVLNHTKSALHKLLFDAIVKLIPHKQR
jgi:hypothetical protein